MGTAAISITGIIAILAFVVIRLNRHAPRDPFQDAFGIVANLSELRAATRKPGGMGCSGQRPVTDDVRTRHDGTGV